MTSYTIQKINTALLEEYVSNLKDSFTSFKMNQNDYKNSYLMQKTESSLVSIVDKLDKMYTQIETGYENILKWWEDYNENVVGLDQFIARKGNRIKEAGLSSFASAHFSDLTTYKLNLSNTIAYNYKNNVDYTHKIDAETTLTGTASIHKNPFTEQIDSQKMTGIGTMRNSGLTNPFIDALSGINKTNSNLSDSTSTLSSKQDGFFHYVVRDLTNYKNVLSEEEWKRLLETEEKIGTSVANLKNQKLNLRKELGKLQFQYGIVSIATTNVYQGKARLPEEWLSYLDKDTANRIRIKQGSIPDYTILFNQTLMNQTGCKNYEDYLGKVEELKTSINELDGFVSQLEQYYEVLPYVFISESKDYNSFSKENKYNYNLDYNSFEYLEETVSELEKWLDKTDFKYANGLKEIGINSLEDYEDFSLTYFLSEENRKMYFYLKEKNPTLASEYIASLEDSINQARGAAEAYQFLNTLDENKVTNFLKTFGQGTGDGIQTFFDGLENLFKADGVLSVEDYKRAIILQCLSKDENYKKYLPATYQFSTSFGNMVPSIAASAIVTFVATPAGGAAVMSGTTAGNSAMAVQTMSKLVGTGLMGLSAAGNATEGAMQQGYGKFESYIYGAFNGMSEATLQYFLGSIPGVSRLEGLTLGRLFSEGIEEGSQEYVDAILRKCILGEEINLEEVIRNSGTSFLMGVSMSAFLNGGQTVINYGGKKIVLTVDKINEMYKSSDVNTMLSIIQETNAVNTMSSNIQENNAPLKNLEILQDQIGEEFIVKENPADLVETGRLIPIKNLLSIIQNEEIYNKFNTDFYQNKELFGGIDKKNYFLGIEQLFQTLSKNQYDVSFTVDEMNRVNTLLEQFYTLKKRPFTFNTMQDFVNTDINQVLSNKIIIKGMPIDIKTAYEMQKSIKNYLRCKRNFNTDVALKMNDPKQYLISKIESALTQTKSVEELKNIVAAINEIGKNNGDIDFNKLYRCMSGSLTKTDITNVHNMINNQKSLCNQISPLEVDAIKAYTKIMGPILNAYQRHAKTNFRGGVYDGTSASRVQEMLNRAFNACISQGVLTKESSNVIASVEGLENIIEGVIQKSGPLQENVTVYRAVDYLYFDGKHIVPKIGTRFNDTAFVSTSLLEQGTMKNRKMIMEIEVPAGTKGAYIEPFAGINNYGQQEFLLDKNQTFEITGIESTKDGQLRLKVKVVQVNEITAYELDTMHVENKTKLYDRYYRGRVEAQQVELNEVVAKMKQENLMNRFHDEVADLNKRSLYNFNFAEHNQDHAERVLFYAMYLGNLEAMTTKNYDILVEAAKFHDIGRGISKDNHALASAMQIDRILQNEYSLNDLNLIQAVIELHEMNYEKDVTIFWRICSKYGINNNQVADLRQISNILKDADALDRVRFPGNLKPEYLRTNEAKTMIKAVNEFQEIRGEKKLKDMLNSNTVNRNVKLYIQNSIKNGESPYRTWFNLWYGVNF